MAYILSLTGNFASEVSFSMLSGFMGINLELSVQCRICNDQAYD